MVHLAVSILTVHIGCYLPRQKDEINYFIFCEDEAESPTKESEGVKEKEAMSDSEGGVAKKKKNRQHRKKHGTLSGKDLNLRVMSK